MINASELTAWLKKQLGLGYVYGTLGQTCTEALLRGREAAYGKTMGAGYYHLNGDYKKGQCAKWLGKTVYDCSGLIKVGRREFTGKLVDENAHMMYTGAKARGARASMPLQPGVAVFVQSNGRMSHVGLYIGGGKVIEARGVKYGVVETDLAARAWTHWGTFAWLDYDIPRESGQTAPSTGAETDAGDVEDALASKGDLYAAVCTGSSVHVRTGRSAQHSSLGLAKRGETIIALPAVDDWCEVAAVIGGRLVKGFMSAQYVQKK